VRVPNLAGARLAGYHTEWMDAVDAAAAAALVVVLDVELDPAEQAAVRRAKAEIVIGTVDDGQAPRADLVLPTTNFAEENGTYVNRDRRVQRYYQAKAVPGMARPAWWIASLAIDRSGADAPATAADAFVSLGSTIPALAGLTYGELGHTGRVLDPAAVGAAR